MTTVTEKTETAETKAAKKPRVAPHRANVAAKAKASKKATPAKKAPKGGAKAKVAETSARHGSKTAKILDLLKRPGGATAKELLKVTGWQAHSLRGFISGTLGKKMGLAVASLKSEDGGRSYSVKG
jgi:Protein of unknown function (DUF3489)